MEDEKKHRKEIRKWLDVDYTPEEISDMSMELAQKTGELRTKEENKKSAMSQLKSEIDALSARTNELSLKIVSGKENKNVKCEIEYNYETNKKSITRLDTLEVIFFGDIPEDEKQMEMDLKDDEKPSQDEQTPGGPVDTSGIEQPPSDTPQTEESQDKIDSEDEAIKEKIKESQEADKKESPLIYESAVGPKAQK